MWNILSEMATIKFKDVSLYKQQHPAGSAEDFLYHKHLEDFQMKRKNENGVIGVAMFGVGRAGTIHISSLLRNSRVKVLYIVEEDKNKWDSIRNYWNTSSDIKFRTFQDVQEVYNDKNVRAIIVTTPTKTHEEIVTTALDHNKAVFCEKPVAETIEKAQRCFDKAKKAGQPLFIAFNRRFDPAFSSVRERVRNGELGHVNIIKTSSRDSPLPPIEYLRVSGGVFQDTCVHNIDTLVWVLGEYPTKASVLATANIPEVAAIPDYDTVAITLTFPSGTVGIIDISRFSNYGYDQRMEVFGFKGMLTVDNQEPLQGVETCGVEHKLCPIYYSFASRFQHSYINEMEHFLNVVEGKEKLKMDPKDVLAVSKIASACEESAKTGKIVDIKWSKEELSYIES